jgi:hypothetical protein
MTRVASLLLIAGTMVVRGQQVTGRLTANIRGGDGDGKCTIEALVDQVAEVEVQGRTAIIRTISGSPASLRRFDCNQEMPRNPSGFRFKGVDGRGRQDLVRNPSEGGRAVVRIEDSQGGSEGYTFDLIWTGGGFGGGYESGGRFDHDGSGYGHSGGWDNGWGSGRGWSNRGSFTFDSGRRGRGEFRDRSGNRQHLNGAHVVIKDSGDLEVSFDGEHGRLSFAGRVDDRDGRRVFGQVRGAGIASGAKGRIEIEFASREDVRNITLPDIDLRWSN